MKAIILISTVIGMMFGSCSEPVENPVKTQESIKVDTMYRVNEFEEYEIILVERDSL